MIGAGVEIGDGVTVDDDLRAAVAAGFEQYRVEVDTRGKSSGLRLQGLGAADFTAIDRHR